MCFYNCKIDLINVPLMALIDYRGYRVVAMSVLPISSKTIIYGSDTAGVNVYNKDENFNQLMIQASEKLNLRGHLVGFNEQILIYGPCDIEGHLSDVDKNYYLCDFARVMPPQYKFKKDSHPTQLYELLRPELVKSNPVPLSSDALTAMGSNDPKKSDYNRDVKEACIKLLKQIIPNMSSTLDSCENLIAGKDIIAKIHRAGINVRHLGLLRKGCKNNDSKLVLLTEMVARIMKDEIKKKMRNLLKNSPIAAEHIFQKKF